MGEQLQESLDGNYSSGSKAVMGRHAEKAMMSQQWQESCGRGAMPEDQCWRSNN